MAMQYNRRTGRWESKPEFFAPPVTPGKEVVESGQRAGVIPTPTTAPRRATTTTTPPRQTTTTTTPRTTTTAPRGTTTTTTAPRSTTTATPKPRTYSGRGMGGPTAAQVQAGQYVGGKGFQTQDTADLTSALNEQFANIGGLSGLIAAMNASSGGGGRTSGWKPNPMAAAAGFAAAGQQERAGREASAAYNDLATSQLNQALANIGGFYGTQQTQSEDAIRRATADLMASLPSSTGFQQAQFTTLPQQQQALADLARYGATGELAQAASAQDDAMARAIQGLMQTSAGQMGQAEQGYLNAIRTAAQGGQAAALQGLQQNLATTRAGDEAAARAIQQQLLTQGIEALMGGKTAAATTRAQTVAEYGRPKKRKKS